MEDRDIEAFVQGHASLLEHAHHFLVSLLEIGRIQTEPVDRRRALIFR